MKRILYLHGLESPQGGDKIDFLTQENLVIAPKINYKDLNIFFKLRELVDKVKPDYIIGSSIGGRYAYHLAASSPFRIKTILFNPAIYKNIQDDFLNKKPLLYNGCFNYPELNTFVVGLQDDIVDPYKIIEIHEKNSNIIQLKDIGHRIPLFDFINIYNQTIKNDI